MAWAGFPKVNLAGFGDLAGAVNKQLQDSVKKLEKNFDTALGFEGLTADGTPIPSPGPAAANGSNSQTEASKALEHPTSTPTEASEPVQAATASVDVPEKTVREPERVVSPAPSAEPVDEDLTSRAEPESAAAAVETKSEEGVSQGQENVSSGSTMEELDKRTTPSQNGILETSPRSLQTESVSSVEVQSGITGLQKGVPPEESSRGDAQQGGGGAAPTSIRKDDSGAGTAVPASPRSPQGVALLTLGPAKPASPKDRKPFPGGKAGPDGDEAEKLRGELQAMEASMLQAAKQAQTKADEIARLGTVIDELKAELEQLKQKASEQSELEVLREEFQTRQGAAERKIYALTKERDMLRREASRKSDTSTLIKEKDEIIKQVMAEGEELSKKQAAQEGLIKKLRAQIRDLEADKEKLGLRVAVEEAKVEGLLKDKAKTEQHLKEAVERSQAELEAQKEYYSTALTQAQEALAKAEAAADNAARFEMDAKLKEATEREQALVRTVEELRESITRTTLQAAYREDVLRRDVEELQQRCQAAEARHEELSARVPESTRPLLRQIEALQEAAANRAESWSAVERSLNMRLQDAEGKAAAAQERERAANERLSQTMQRLAVMEAQLACLRTEHAQLSRSLEKERQRSSENRQEFLAVQEAAATQEGRALQLEEEVKELRNKAKKDALEHKAAREQLEQELESVKSALREAEKRPHRSSMVERGATSTLNHALSGTAPEEPRQKLLRRLSSNSSVGSLEESAILQNSLQWPNRPPTPPHLEHQSSSGFLRGYGGGNSNAAVAELDSLLRQKEGELQSYLTRLRQMESTRDSLAEELVKTTTQCETLRAEVALLPGLRAELESLRKRHASALELMGERDEEVEELRMDLLEHKELYRNQVDLLVGQIERLSKQVSKA